MDFIQHTKSCFPKDECENIIEYFHTNKDGHQPGNIGGQVDFDKKQFTELHMDMREMHTSSFPSKMMWLQPCFEKYKKTYDFLTQTHPWGPSPLFKIQEYLPGNHYKALHCENDVPIHHPASNRCVAWMVYLNDVELGGHTEFPYQEKSFKPTQGDVLMWPAYWTHPHRGCEVSEGTKYILTGWFTYIGDHSKLEGAKEVKL